MSSVIWISSKSESKGIGNTLPKTNIAPENRPSKKETSIPTIHFQVRTVSFREGIFRVFQSISYFSHQVPPRQIIGKSSRTVLYPQRIFLWRSETCSLYHKNLIIICNMSTGIWGKIVGCFFFMLFLQNRKRLAHLGVGESYHDCHSLAAAGICLNMFDQVIWILENLWKFRKPKAISNDKWNTGSKTLWLQFARVNDSSILAKP